MSKAAMTWALGLRIEDGAMKPVLVHLAYLHHESRPLFPSQQRLALATGNSVRTVIRALALLEHFGLISRKSRSNGAGGRSSDTFALAISCSDLAITKSKIRAARIGLAAPKKSQRAKMTGAPRQNGTGIGELIEAPFHEVSTSEVVVDPSTRGTPRLTVIGGGRS